MRMGNREMCCQVKKQDEIVKKEGRRGFLLQAFDHVKIRSASDNCEGASFQHHVPFYSLGRMPDLHLDRCILL